MTKTFIPGKDEALETSIANIGQAIQDLGFHIEEARWLNPVGSGKRWSRISGLAVNWPGACLSEISAPSTARVCWGCSGP